MGSLRDSIGHEARRQYGLDLCPDLDRAAELRVRRSAEASHHWADQLKAEHGQNEKHAHDFAGAALRQPALQPREDRLHQDKVEKCEGQKDYQRPGK